MAAELTLDLPPLRGEGSLEGEVVPVSPALAWVPVIGWSERPRGMAGLQLLVEPVAAIVAMQDGTLSVPIGHTVAYPETTALGNPGAALSTTQRLALFRAVCGPAAAAGTRIPLARLELHDNGRVVALTVGLLLLGSRPAFAASLEDGARRRAR